MSDKLIRFYDSVLAFGGLKYNDKGEVYGQISKEFEAVPLIVGGKKLVMPIRSQLDSVDQDKNYFHPLCESFLRGESEVYLALKECITTKLNYSIAVIAYSLLKLLVSVADHKKLNEEQSELLQFIPEAGKDTWIRWGEMMNKVIKGDSDNKFVKLYVKRSGTWNNATYSRVGVVSFPFYINLQQGKIGDKLSQKDKSAFIKVLKFMLPALEESESYNFGTRTKVAPFLESLLGSASRVAVRLQELVELYRPFIQNVDSVEFDLKFANEIGALESFATDIRNIGELRGNVGSPPLTEKTSHVVEDTSQALNQNVSVVSPVQQAAQASMPPAPQFAAQPVQQFHQPVHSQPPPITAPRVNDTGAVNFSDVMKLNPALAANAYVGMGFAQPAVPMRTEPTWARPAAPVYQHAPYPQAAYPQHAYPQVMPQMMPAHPGQVFHQYPQMQQQPVQNGLPPPPPGYMYVMGQNGQPIAVPMQGNPQMGMQPAMQPAQNMPTGWTVR